MHVQGLLGANMQEMSEAAMVLFVAQQRLSALVWQSSFFGGDCCWGVSEILNHDAWCRVVNSVEGCSG